MAGESIGNYSVVDTATVGVVVVTNNKSSIANTFQPVLAPDVRILLGVGYVPTQWHLPQTPDTEALALTGYAPTVQEA